MGIGRGEEGRGAVWIDEGTRYWRGARCRGFGKKYKKMGKGV